MGHARIGTCVLMTVSQNGSDGPVLHISHTVFVFAAAEALSPLPPFLFRRDWKLRALLS